MTVSRASRIKRMALCAAAAGLLSTQWPGDAHAQGTAVDSASNRPVSGLLGSELSQNPSLATSRALAPINGMGTAGWQEAPWSAPRWQTPVLHFSEGGFTGDIWLDSDPNTIVELVEEMPSARESASAYQLARRLLLSAAVPPQGVDDVTWQVMRVERLAALGDLSGLQRLLALLPAGQAGALRERVRAEIALLTGDRDVLCQMSDGRTPSAGQDSFWHRVATVCQVERNDSAALRQHLEDLQLAGTDNGTARLAWALLEGQPLGDALLVGLEDVSLGAPEAQLLQRFSYTQVRPLWHRVSADGRMALAQDRRSDLRLRTLASEWAVATQRLPAEHLAAAYEDFPFAEADLRAGVGANLNLRGPVARAFAWQSLALVQEPQERLWLLESALELAEKDRCYAGVAAVLLPRLDFSPDNAAFAGTSGLAGRALYVMGRYEEATAWMLVARRESTISAQAANASWRLWPYARLAGLALPNDTTGLIAWRSTQSYEPEGLVSARETLLRELLRALGDGFNQGWVSASAQQAYLPSAESGSGMALRSASSRGQLGETLLRVVILVDGHRDGAASPGTLALAVEALDRIGLPLEARALAIEAAHHAGI